VGLAVIAFVKETYSTKYGFDLTNKEMLGSTAAKINLLRLNYKWREVQALNFHERQQVL